MRAGRERMSPTVREFVNDPARPEWSRASIASGELRVERARLDELAALGFLELARWRAGDFGGDRRAHV
jgi:hypothetical protein